MFFASVVLALTVVSVSAHSIHHVRRHHAPRAQPPVGWATNYLENYDTYHARYLAVGCENKHNTTFFDMCCHPMLATETLEKNRAPCCAPDSTAQCPSSSSSAAAPASTSTDDDEDCDDDGDDVGDNDDDEDCDDGDEGEDASSTVTSVKAPSSTPANHDDDEEDCDESGDSDSSAAQGTKAVHHATATSTHVVASTHSSSEAAPTTTAVKTSTTSTADKSTKTTSSTSFPLVTGGFGTWFTQNGVAGACGKVHKDSDFVVALPTEAYENGAHCGHMIRVFKADDDDTYVDAVVADECPTCINNKCVDMSRATFEKLASLSVGEFSIKYQFLD